MVKQEAKEQEEGRDPKVHVELREKMEIKDIKD